MNDYLGINTYSLDKGLVSRYGITMARFPDWCEKYGALKNVPTEEIEKKITIRGTTADSLKTTKQWRNLLLYLLKRNGELVRMYATNGERSVKYLNQTQYHAIVVMDSTRIRLFYQYDKQRGYERGWMVHYIMMYTNDEYEN